MPTLEERVANMEGCLDEGRFTERFNRLESKIDSNFRTTVTLLLTSWITLMVAIAWHH